MKYPIRARHVGATLLVGAFLVSGCGIGFGPAPTRPPEAVAVGVYTRGGAEPPTFMYVVTSEHADPQLGIVTDRAGGTCFWAGGTWTLEVHQEGRGLPDPADEPLATFESGDPPANPTELAISVDGAGRVELTEGVPAWWSSDRQRCGL